ncbi:hypothetical protein PIB30_032612 [Stylosanthes scabra]|uniref:Uncharacterized protein n=1 Tax=Stylosanthes scabra TaxID=79078 RepID=A0ABU6UCP2_9FABA|nr:hypothetical protein [Stylosanthes scabra]
MAESLDYVTMKLPAIYLLDCTLNDCDLLLKSANQGEVYPALILFPAEIKKAVLYEGDMAVIDIMKFVTDHGSNFHHLIKEKALWVSERVVKNQDLYDTLQTEIHEESLKHSKYVAAPVHDIMRDEVIKPNVMNSPVSDGPHETLPHVVTGSVLIATEKLSGVQPFDGAKILIVAADQLTGFQGLIINKRIEWNVMPAIKDSFEKLMEAPLSFGGPVIQSGLPLSSLTTVSGGSFPEILPGICFLDQSGVLPSAVGEVATSLGKAVYLRPLGPCFWSCFGILNLKLYVHPLGDPPFFRTRKNGPRQRRQCSGVNAEPNKPNPVQAWAIAVNPIAESSMEQAGGGENLQNTPTIKSDRV